MTNEEMIAEADRALVKYARNEKTIVCLLERLLKIARSFDRIATELDLESCQHSLQELGGHNLHDDVKRLEAAFSERGGMEADLLSHGYHHMLSR